MSGTELVTEFLLAAEEGNSDALKACLEKGVDINATNRQKRTAVIIASLKKHYSCVELLIAAGADIDKQDQTCFNPFLISCLTNDLTLLRIVLPANPDLDRLTRFGGVGITPASEKGHVEIVRELLEKTDINVNHTNFVGWTPLLEAIVLNDGGAKQQEIVKLLLNHGANPHMTDKYGKTPLELAREKGFTAIADLLLAAGA
ncbi:ankyrin repeat domain-containing protein [Enterobacter sp. A11]|uniref:Ankyrin repeat domain-containing protein n=1 Tax=Enterobacter cloacae TaxID=550 RepID=A0A4Q2E795_ENTCL|nr:MULTISPECIES: ankyrin repeat domain-containing protein [Enterobacter]MBO4146961.1 ankyrin repeat domain-containing protein [Enterobacter ludwigii]HDT2074862.1 ankyrin repeat domain-containing protein [Enterobacter roggenkampii]HEG2000419.1 ankyrin repeat domain-containing protein [Enterobacter asburiae]MBM1021958.1 ankyrin repeat domain-containing protein [Enterobacter sp. E1]MCD2459229.1 ankyrin repeat domain-containing protein [Enterobacter cloacae complex sp. 2021EL-01261]